MLESYRSGYAVMSADRTGISFESETIETCKRYCGDDYVIVRVTPKVMGFSLTVNFFKKWHRPFGFKKYNRIKNILWMHFYFTKEYSAHYGEIIYKNEK